MNSTMIFVYTPSETVDAADLHARANSHIKTPHAWADILPDHDSPRRWTIAVTHLDLEEQENAAGEIFAGLDATTDWQLESLHAYTEETTAINF